MHILIEQGKADTLPQPPQPCPAVLQTPLPPYPSPLSSAPANLCCPSSFLTGFNQRETWLSALWTFACGTCKTFRGMHMPLTVLQLRHAQVLKGACSCSLCLATYRGSQAQAAALCSAVPAHSLVVSVLQHVSASCSTPHELMLAVSISESHM